MSRKFVLVLSGLILFFVFILFSYLVHENFLTAVDFDTTIRLQDNISRRFDDVFSLFSDIGKFEVMTIVLLTTIIFTRKIIGGILAFSSYVIFHFIEIFGKFFVDHQPPPEFMLRTKRIVDFPQFTVRLENSYPSGHSGRTLFLSVILIILICYSRLPIAVKVILVFLIVCFDATMFISRIYLGEHWTSDVIGGAILGGGLGLISGGLLLSSFKNSVPKPKNIKN